MRTGHARPIEQCFSGATLQHEMNRFIRRHLSRIIIRVFAGRFTIYDFQVVVLYSRMDVDRNYAVQRLGEAIALLRTYMPVRYRHATRDISGIRIDRQPVRGYFDCQTRECVLDLLFLTRSDFTVVHIAATFLHEAMHARIHARGGKYTAESAARHERACRRAELKFGQLVPGGESIVERAQALLEAPDEVVAPKVDWRGEHQRALAEDIETLPVPKWVKRRMLKRLEKVRSGQT